MVRKSAVTMAEAEDLILAYVKLFAPAPGSAPLCGNSIATDRGFLARDMPRLDGHLHYRMIDVLVDQGSSPAAGIRAPITVSRRRGSRTARWRTSRKAFASWTTTRHTVFVPGLGPDVDQAKAIAAEVSAVRPID